VSQRPHPAPPDIISVSRNPRPLALSTLSTAHYLNHCPAIPRPRRRWLSSSPRVRHLLLAPHAAIWGDLSPHAVEGPPPHLLPRSRRQWKVRQISSPYMRRFAEVYTTMGEYDKGVVERCARKQLLTPASTGSSSPPGGSSSWRCSSGHPTSSPPASTSRSARASDPTRHRSPHQGNLNFLLFPPNIASVMTSQMEIGANSLGFVG
jgi:hypothetical protein